MVVYTERGDKERIISAKRRANVSKKSTSGKSNRSESESVDVENPLLGGRELHAMKRVAPVKRIRRQLGLSQEDFAKRFAIPIGTIRDWEQGRSRPDQAAASYLKVIGSDPALVSRALGTDARRKLKQREKA